MLEVGQMPAGNRDQLTHDQGVCNPLPLQDTKVFTVPAGPVHQFKHLRRVCIGS
jgi:hypothetical protein